MNVAIVIVIIILIPLLSGLIRTWQTQNSPNQKLFLNGHIPSPLPDGLYKGSVAGLNVGWQGKKFNATNSSGINLIDNEEKYPFKTYVGKGIQDKNLDVLKIDYNIPASPFWLKFILDEIVEISPNHFLGKVHINFFGFPFSLGYFRLNK